MRVAISAVLAMVFVLSGISAPAQGEPVVNAVTAWDLIAVRHARPDPGSGERSAPAVFRSTWG